MIYRGATASRLAILRIVVFGMWFVHVALEPLSSLPALPLDWFEPYGPWLLVPQSFLEAIWRPSALIFIKAGILVCLALALTGVRHPRLWGIASLAALITHESFVRGFGHANHAQLQLIFVTAAVTFLPAWDSLSIVSTRVRAMDSPVYEASFSAVALVFALPYCAIGVHRVAYSGLHLFASDAMAQFVVRDVLSAPHFGLDWGLHLVEHRASRALLGIGFAAVTLAELAAPWAHLHRRICFLFVAVLALFHIASPFIMDVLFTENVVLLAVLYAWPLAWPWPRAVDVARSPL